jgi:hypothetical protein
MRENDKKEEEQQEENRVTDYTCSSVNIDWHSHQRRLSPDQIKVDGINVSLRLI